jgi:hypothetical protein
MQITFDLGPRRDVFKNKDIWMLVDDKKLVLSQREFLNQILLVSFPYFFASQVDNFVIIASLSLCSDGCTQDI